MSAPLLIGCAAVALGLGLPVMAAAGQVEAQHRAAGAADAAALAAADAASGWVEVDPCTLARQTAEGVGAVLSRCEVDAASREARVVVRAGELLAAGEARAHAGFLGGSAALGANGWVWPSGVRGVNQGFHDGYSIDLAVGSDGALLAPFDGVVVRAGPDGGGIPEVCLANPAWWRGPNHTVLIRHEYAGRVLFSSHNHIAPGSAQGAGVTVGSRVRAGQRVASAGMSGCTSGPHTHFTLASTPTNAHPDINPYQYLGVP